MSKITLIRHGQASFGAKNYDLLSDRGRKQAAAVGEYFKNCAVSYHSIIHGDMSRQSETASIISSSMGYCSDLISLSGANEFDSESLLKHYLPCVARQSERLHQAIYGENHWFKSEEKFKEVFSALISAWQNDQHCQFESWQSFKHRAISFLNQIATEQADKNIMVVTSGGLISVAFMSLLELEDKHFINLNLSINNASVTDIGLNLNPQSKLRLSGQLLSFNNISPLLLTKDKQMITRK